MSGRWDECGNCYGNGCFNCGNTGRVENSEWADDYADHRYEEYRERLAEDRWEAGR